MFNFSKEIVILTSYNLLILKTRGLNILIWTFSIMSLVVMTACGGKSDQPDPEPKPSKKPTYEDSLNAQKDSMKIESKYDMETVDRKHQKEFMQNLKKIEDKYGDQWDFCTCVVKNDSINTAIQNQSLSDKDFDRLIARMDAIDQKCKAFLVQSPNQTPEERLVHNKKVKDCLKSVGKK